MSKSKISGEEFLNDLDEVFKIISELDNENISLNDISKMSERVKIVNKKIKNKYKDLDSKK